MRGFTAASDILVEKYGLITASIYGVVWRYCQMERGHCNAKHSTIGERLGISGKSVQRYIKPLLDDGYLLHLNPEDTHKSHQYICSDKLDKEELDFYAQGWTDCPPISTEGKTNSPPQVDNESTLGRTDCPPKKVVKESIKETTTKEEEGFAADFPDIINAMDERAYPPYSQAELKPVYDGLSIPEGETPIQWFEYVLDRNQQSGDKSLECMVMVFEAINLAGSLAKFKQSDRPVKQGEHPAIEAYKEVWGAYPRRNCQQDIIQEVGDNSDRLAEWGKATKAWKLAGYKFDNYKGQFDWLNNGIPTNKGDKYATNSASDQRERNRIANTTGHMATYYDLATGTIRDAKTHNVVHQ